MLIRMPEDHHLNVDGLKTRYWVLGESGTNIILIHGLGGSADIWMHNVHPLAREHRVYVPDLPGFGESDRPGPRFSPFDYTRFLSRFMSLLHIEKASLVGQSLGGGIALHCALCFPECVDKLVLVDSAGLGREVIWTLRVMSLPLLGELSTRPTRKSVELFFRFAVRNQGLITNNFIEQYWRFFSARGFQTFLLRMVRTMVTIRGAKQQFLKPIVDNLEKIGQPALVIWGSEDRVLPLKHGRFAQQRLPNAVLEVVEGCGHLPFFERPDEFNRLVLAFLQSE